MRTDEAGVPRPTRRLPATSEAEVRAHVATWSADDLAAFVDGLATAPEDDRQGPVPYQVQRGWALRHAPVVGDDLLARLLRSGHGMAPVDVAHNPALTVGQVAAVRTYALRLLPPVTLRSISLHGTAVFRALVAAGHCTAADPLVRELQDEARGPIDAMRRHPMATCMILAACPWLTPDDLAAIARARSADSPTALRYLFEHPATDAQVWAAAMAAAPMNPGLRMVLAHDPRSSRDGAVRDWVLAEADDVLALALLRATPIGELEAWLAAVMLARPNLLRGLLTHETVRARPDLTARTLAPALLHAHPRDREWLLEQFVAMRP